MRLTGMEVNLFPQTQVNQRRYSGLHQMFQFQPGGGVGALKNVP